MLWIIKNMTNLFYQIEILIVPYELIKLNENIAEGLDSISSELVKTHSEKLNSLT